MSHFDRFTSKGTFRGVEFVISDDDMEFGRRVVKHEFPLRDEVSAEDLGKKTREHSATVFVLGDDYLDKRDALIEAIEKRGAGILVHPYYGSINVTISNSRVRHSTSEGGYCRFTLTFFITPPVPTLQETDTQEKVELSVLESIAESIDDFAGNFEIIGQAADLVADIEADLDNVMDAIDNVVSVTEDINALIRAPFNMGVAIAGAFNKVKTTLQNSARTFDLYSEFFGLDVLLDEIPLTTDNRKQQVNNMQAQRRLISQVALASAIQISSEIDYASLDDAIAMRDELLDAIDLQIGQPMSVELYQAYTAMRAALVIDLRVRGMQLPKLSTYTPKTILPAIVIAHQIYGDATREAELVERNNIVHPGFVSGGTDLQVLANV